MGFIIIFLGILVGGKRKYFECECCVNEDKMDEDVVVDVVKRYCKFEWFFKGLKGFCLENFLNWELLKVLIFLNFMFCCFIIVLEEYGVLFLFCMLIVCFC